MQSSITMSTSTCAYTQEPTLLQGTEQVGLRVRAHQRDKPDHRRVRWGAFEDSQQGNVAFPCKRQNETTEKAVVQQK